MAIETGGAEGARAGNGADTSLPTWQHQILRVKVLAVLRLHLGGPRGRLEEMDARASRTFYKQSALHLASHKRLMNTVAKSSKLCRRAQKEAEAAVQSGHGGRESMGFTSDVGYADLLALLIYVLQSGT